MFVADNQHDWDKCLPYVIMAYRTSVHETTGCTHSEMMLGRDIGLPSDLLMGRLDDDTCEVLIEYAEQLRDRLEQVDQYACKHLRIASDQQKKNYDQKAQAGGYKEGEAVWLHNPKKKKGISPKLQRPWEGPYVVLKRLSDVTFRIQKGPKTTPRVVHYNRLKKYFGENPPTWMKFSGDGERQNKSTHQEKICHEEKELRGSQQKRRTPGRFDDS